MVIRLDDCAVMEASASDRPSSRTIDSPLKIIRGVNGRVAFDMATKAISVQSSYNFLIAKSIYLL